MRTTPYAEKNIFIFHSPLGEGDIVMAAYTKSEARAVSLGLVPRTDFRWLLKSRSLRKGARSVHPANLLFLWYPRRRLRRLFEPGSRSEGSRGSLRLLWNISLLC
jgi:hypothetical protein